MAATTVVSPRSINGTYKSASDTAAGFLVSTVAATTFTITITNLTLAQKLDATLNLSISLQVHDAAGQPWITCGGMGPFPGGNPLHPHGATTGDPPDPYFVIDAADVMGRRVRVVVTTSRAVTIGATVETL
jgi:hypothetical protein